MLRESDVEVDEVNFAKVGLDDAQLRAIVKAVGSVAGVLNLRHALAKERGWAETPPSVDELVTAAKADPNVIRRPILIKGKTVLVGFDKTNRDRWTSL